MRRFAFIVVGGAVWLLLGAVPASADNGPHVTGAGVVADGCAGCHRAHTGVAAKLLVQAQPALCFTCHGSTGTGAATNVVDGSGYTAATRLVTPPGALRGGGFTNARLDSATPSGQVTSPPNAAGVVPALAFASAAATTSTHTNNGTNGTAWGNGAIGSGAGPTVQLSCSSCHDPHGNGNYRILRALPTGGTGTSAPIADATTKVYTTTNYWLVSDSNAVGFIANVSAWCSTCHTRYLASGSSATTDSGDAIFRYRHRSSEVAQGSANCIQCHVAHGSNASVSGTYSNAVTNPDGTAAVGDSRLLRINNRGTCQMCHSR